MPIPAKENPAGFAIYEYTKAMDEARRLANESQAPAFISNAHTVHEDWEYWVVGPEPLPGATSRRFDPDPKGVI